MSGNPRLVTFALAVGAVVACGALPLPDDHARTLVRTYNDRVAAAYRTAAPELADGVVGPEEAHKLAELIAIKLERGTVLDGELLELEVTRIERPARRRIVVETGERWRYVDREIVTGKPVGEPVVERYAMRYVIEPVEGVWVITRVEFADPPD